MLWALIRRASLQMSIYNICFYEELEKIIPELLSNTSLIKFTTFVFYGDLKKIIPELLSNTSLIKLTSLLILMLSGTNVLIA